MLPLTLPAYILAAAEEEARSNNRGSDRGSDRGCCQGLERRFGGAQCDDPKAVQLAVALHLRMSFEKPACFGPARLGRKMLLFLIKAG